MGLRDKFAEQYARQKTMTGPEKKVNDTISRILLKKTLIFLLVMIVVSVVGPFVKIPWWGILIIDALIAVGAYFFIKNEGKKFQNFVPYVGTLISLEKKGKDEYTVLLKQGKKPVKLEIKHGGEDFEKVRKNSLVQISYNPDAKMAVLVNANAKQKISFTNPK